MIVFILYKNVLSLKKQEERLLVPSIKDVPPVPSVLSLRTEYYRS